MYSASSPRSAGVDAPPVSARDPRSPLPLLCTSAEQLRQACGEAPVFLVPTMGALHAGHVWLVEQARRRAESYGVPGQAGLVAVSIFVNPLQFDDPADLRRYPRTLNEDLQQLAGLADVVYAPEQMYPYGLQSIRVDSGPVGKILEGASRPGFFEGVLTVVAKLLQQVRPVEAFFSRKDAQQAFLIKRMVQELDFPCTVRVTDFLRDAHGLPYSSRNRRLSPMGLSQAQHFSQALLKLADNPPPTVGQCCLQLAEFAAATGVKLEYAQAVDENFAPLPPESMLPLTGTAPGKAGEASSPAAALLLAAARIEEIRVLDNVVIGGENVG